MSSGERDRCQTHEEPADEGLGIGQLPAVEETPLAREVDEAPLDLVVKGVKL